MLLSEDGRPLQGFAAVPSVQENPSNAYLSIYSLAATSLVDLQQVYKVLHLRQQSRGISWLAALMTDWISYYHELHSNKLHIVATVFINSPFIYSFCFTLIFGQYFKCFNCFFFFFYPQLGHSGCVQEVKTFSISSML